MVWISGHLISGIQPDIRPDILFRADSSASLLEDQETTDRAQNHLSIYFSIITR